LAEQVYLQVILFLYDGVVVMSGAVDEFILKHLGERTLRKIENRLFEKYKIPLDQVLLEFEKFDTVLHEFFGEGAEGLEYQLFKSLHAISK
jgi:hypothetical protein